MSHNYAGYPAQVWATCYQSMTWLANLITTNIANVSAIYGPTNLVFDTLLNGVHAIDAWQAGNTLAVEAQNMIAIEALPISIDTVSQNYFTSRVEALNDAFPEILALVPTVNPFKASANLSNGQPAIAYPGFIEWAMTFQGEVPPFGISLPSGGDEVTQAWLNITNAINVLQGTALTSAYDTAARQYRCSAVVASVLDSLVSGPFSPSILLEANQIPLYDSAGNPLLDSAGNPIFTSGETLSSLAWNQTVAIPTYLLDVASFASAPATFGAQQSAVIRYALISQLQSLANLLLALRIHTVTQPTTATLRNTESLADLAARTTGNFENWTTLANLNEIQPPYPGPSNQTLALQGKQLFTSKTPGILPDPDSSGVSYLINVLGADWDWGPINGTQPPWTGDINIITGYYNFARSIGRRLQTPLGALIYHKNYGDRIPGEVGAIQSADEAARLLQYGRSAILSDPRTGLILSSQASTQPGFLANFSAIIQPIGGATQPVQINEVIGGRP